MSPSGPIYGFDGVDQALSFPPTAARRALDNAGESLTLEGWRSLAHADRLALVAAGALATIDGDEVRSIIASASPAARRIEPKADPNPDQPPPQLLHALGDSRTLSGAEWASFRPLDRYALSDAAAETGPRLSDAYDEIVRPITHLGGSGEMHMVAVAAKAPTARRATASARVLMRPETLARIVRNDAPKGDVFAAARLAGIQAAKRTWELIPLCHPLALTGVQIDVSAEEARDGEPACVRVKAMVDAFDRTGVEMEALVAASTAALTIYDMLKSIDRWMTVAELRLEEKSGGRSGYLRREGP